MNHNSYYIATLYSTDANDFSPPSFAFNFLTFSNGTTEEFITVTITDDDMFEGTETFNYSLFKSDPVFDALTFAPNVTTFNIVDNEG